MPVRYPAEARLIDMNAYTAELALLATHHIATSVNVPGYSVSVAELSCFMCVDVSNTCLLQPVSQSCSYLCFLINSDALCKVLAYCSTVLHKR
jgi:hypothetical protein